MPESRSQLAVQRLIQATARVASAEKELADAKALKEQIETVDAPDAFLQDGVSEVTLLENGAKAKRSLVARGSLPDKEEFPEAREDALKWVAAPDGGNIPQIIKCKVVAEYDAGDYEKATEVYERLRRDNNSKVTLDQTIHPMTYAKMALEKVKAGDEVPLSMLGIHVGQRVRITVRPREEETNPLSATRE